MDLSVIIVLVVVVVIVAAIVGIYNGLISRRNQIDEALGQIQVQLKRRHDLIPNLVNAVKGYMEFEQKVLTDVTNARAAAGAGREPADGRPALAVRGRRELPTAEGQRERPVAPGGADDDREPDLVQPPALQRDGARLQQRDPDVPEQPARGHVRVRQAAVLRGRGRGRERSERRPQPDLSRQRLSESSRASALANRC
jgi:LemA family